MPAGPALAGRGSATALSVVGFIFLAGLALARHSHTHTRGCFSFRVCRPVQHLLDTVQPPHFRWSGLFFSLVWHFPDTATPTLVGVFLSVFAGRSSTCWTRFSHRTFGGRAYFSRWSGTSQTQPHPHSWVFFFPCLPAGPALAGHGSATALSVVGLIFLAGLALPRHSHTHTRGCFSFRVCRPVQHLLDTVQ